MNIAQKVLISVDLEEFDLPEYAQYISPAERLELPYQGLKKALALLDAHQVRATFFVTSWWAQHFPEAVQRIARQHEIASHGQYHSRFANEDLVTSRAVLEEITGTQVYGCRLPGGIKPDYAALKEAGYIYHAGINPGWGRAALPARTLSIQEEDCYEIPSSTSPLLHYPVYWKTVKNMPAWLTRYFSNVILERDQVLSFHFHTWELCQLDQRLPNHISRVSGNKMLERLDSILGYLENKGQFITHIEWLQEQLCDAAY